MKTLLKAQDGVRLTRTLVSRSPQAVVIAYTVASHRTPDTLSFERLSDAERFYAEELRRCAALH